MLSIKYRCFEFIFKNFLFYFFVVVGELVGDVESDRVADFDLVADEDFVDVDEEVVVELVEFDVGGDVGGVDERVGRVAFGSVEA